MAWQCFACSKRLAQRAVNKYKPLSPKKNCQTNQSLNRDAFVVCLCCMFETVRMSTTAANFSFCCQMYNQLNVRPGNIGLVFIGVTSCMWKHGICVFSPLQPKRLHGNSDQELCLFNTARIKTENYRIRYSVLQPGAHAPLIYVPDARLINESATR